eukprot:2587371-Pleurochrysis_carterae.AAC.1
MFAFGVDVLSSCAEIFLVVQSWDITEKMRQTDNSDTKSRTESIRNNKVAGMSRIIPGSTKVVT